MEGKKNQSQIRTVLRRHASGRADDSTFHHDDDAPHMKAPKADLSAAQRREAAQIRKAGEKKSTKEIFQAAANRALGGGLPGAAAMGIQVCSLMWMRTTMNYQYRHGGGTTAALKHLYNDGGIRRFYRGVGPALIQGPMSRFGDTAANSGMMALLNSYDSTKDLPVFAKTMCASAAAASWRICLMPVDTLKTMLQVEGANGLGFLRAKVAAGGPRVVFHGSLAAAGATYAGHFPWFFTFNYLDSTLPKYDDDVAKKLGRNAGIGFCSSAVSDSVSNSIRVIKTSKQTSEVARSYPQVVRNIIKKEGVTGLMFRGLKTRILANGVQGMMFTVLWKYMEEQFNKRRGVDEEDK